MATLRKNIIEKIKSSPRFGDLFVTKNIQELLKERRFLFFTKNGPIEVVFNLKHYISGALIILMVLFKMLQFIVLGAFHIFTNIMFMKDTSTQVQQFTESEVEALKGLAENVIIERPKMKSEDYLSFKETEIHSIDSIEVQEPIFDMKKIFENTRKFSLELKNGFSSFRDSLSSFNLSAKGDSKLLDESIFDDFSSLANPHMVPIEQTIINRSNMKTQGKSNSFVESNFRSAAKKYSYNVLPVIPFPAPRNNKTKMIQFSKTIDLELIELVNVFKTLKLKPDNIDINEIQEFTQNNLLASEDSKLIDQLSSRFHYLEQLKDAIIFLPLKPPMQYYYVSSPYGMRIHPKTKKKQMHKGIDMAGTWQEEGRASANGVVFFSGRHGSFGKVIKIKHKHGVKTVYGHLHKLMVKKGDFVQEGEIIGKMGATGRVAGAHLHYEIKINDNSVNPYNFISIGRNLVSSSIIK